MPDDLRATAVERLAQLRDCLRQGGDDLSTYVEQTDQLIVAIHASHMEAVRFRLFGLRRQFASHRDTLPEPATGLLEEAGAALQEAGFRT